MSRLEIITNVREAEPIELAPGVEVRILATGSMGAVGVTTALASLSPLAQLPYHTHPFSEVIILLEGDAVVRVEGRSYRLKPLDAIHVPAHTAHTVQNPSTNEPAKLHCSFASETPAREPAPCDFAMVECELSAANSPETLTRFAASLPYELAPDTEFRDLFARRLGSRGICGGYGVFAPGASLPCHYHEYDESITIVLGQAISQVAGREYMLSDCATACIPEGRPHRFLNRSSSPMAMIWVYAGDEPQRTLVDSDYCSGAKTLSDR